MTIENDFLAFATGGGANVLSQSAYAALSAVSTGYQSGVAQSAALNKTWRQSSIMAAVIASFIVQETGQPAIDDGTTATLLANFTTAVVAASKQRVILTDTGTANAYAAANAVPMVALPTASGVVQTVQIAHTNTGASTYAPDGLATKPIFALGGAALQGNELPANGIATLVSFVSPLLNGGNLCWVLYECVGGSQQVAPATASQHAVQLGQVGHGQCYLSVKTATSLQLTPYFGQNLIINGVPQQVPLAGVTVTNGSLSASTLYYVYAAMSGGVMVLNLSATGHSFASNGVQTKTGDVTQTLVGMIFTNASSQFVDSNVQRYCISFFNRLAKVGVVAISGVTYSNTGTLAEISTTARVSFLCWGDEASLQVQDGEMQVSVNGENAIWQASIDGVGGTLGSFSAYHAPNSGSGFPFTSTNCFTLAEGQHYATLLGFTDSAGTVTILQGYTRVTLYG